MITITIRLFAQKRVFRWKHDSTPKVEEAAEKIHQILYDEYPKTTYMLRYRGALSWEILHDTHEVGYVIVGDE